MHHVAWFAAASASVPMARSWVAVELAGWPPALVDDAVLCVSELSANAVLHAHTPFRVELTDQPGVLRLAVRDGNDTVPALRTSGPTDRTGRGLAIVAAVVARWGVASHPAGKTVWCELVLPGTTNPRPVGTDAAPRDHRTR